VVQSLSAAPDSPATYYWLWRFDRPDFPIPPDNLWGKTDAQAVADLHALNDRIIGRPDGPADVELAVDPYFPRTIGSIPVTLRAGPSTSEAATACSSTAT
jgi:hypothetical protein